MTLNLSPSFKRRYADRAEAVAADMARRYGHLALAILSEIHNECDNGDGTVLGSRYGRQMTDVEIAFELDISRANHARVEVIESARRMYGLGSPAYRATYDLANRQRTDDYQRALDKYDSANESGGEEVTEEAPALMAEAAE